MSSLLYGLPSLPNVSNVKFLYGPWLNCLISLISPFDFCSNSHLFQNVNKLCEHSAAHNFTSRDTFGWALK